MGNAKILIWPIFAVVLSSMVQETLSIPIVRSLGCGQPDNRMSIDRRAYCCQHFNLNCSPTMRLKMTTDNDGFNTNDDNNNMNENPTMKTINDDSNGKKGKKTIEDELTNNGKLLHVRNLGQNCESKWVRCATGLQCRLGVCMRDKSLKHFKRLVKVGKEVEDAERMMERDEKAMEAATANKIKSKSSSSNQNEPLLVRGQSIDIGDDNNSPGFVSRKSVEIQVTGSEGIIYLDGRRTNDQYVKNKIQESKLKDKEIERIDKAAVSGDEEDEVTANIADYLASKGKALTKQEWHTVRKLIAGTLDERAEREEEVEQVDSAEAVLRDNEQTERQNKYQKSTIPSSSSSTKSQTFPHPQCSIAETEI